MIPTFESWLHRHRKRNLNNLTPEADKILPLVASAGAPGITRRQLGDAIDLDRDVVDELLAGFVQAGMLNVTYENGVPVFRQT